MAAFPKMTLTNAGQALQTKVLAGETLTFTRIALGDGQLNGQPISPLTALISQKATVEVDSVRVVNTTTAQAAGFFSNEDISTGFWWRETGLFAQDPDVGEILYGYTNAGDAGDYIPTVADTRIEKYIYCSIAVASATTVDITIPSSDTFIPISDKGVPGGVATLDSGGKVPEDQLPDLVAQNVSYTNPSQPTVENVKQALDILQEGLENGTITAVQVTAAASGWSGSPAAQSLTVAGMTADSLYWVGLNSTATYAQRDAARKAVIAPTAQGTNSLTLTCDGAAPTVDLPILVFLSGGAS